MSQLILNRAFEMPADGWYHLAPLGDFPHAAAGLVQVLDPAACAAIVRDFANRAGAPNFPGVLIDFDHFSLDRDKPSEAAGWITELNFRAPDAGDDSIRNAGLWAKIRWSDIGEQHVRGGRYRFLSPVWSRADCEEMDNGRVRPVRLLNAAITNDPNLGGMVPLTNRNTGEPPMPPTAAPPAPPADAVRRRLVEYLNLAPGATDEEILAAMEDVMSAEEVGALQNRAEKAEQLQAALLGELGTVEAELVNRDLDSFPSVIAPDARDYWRDQLLANRERTLAVLKTLAARHPPAEGAPGPAAQPRAPIHNRQTARPPVGPVPRPETSDATAAKILNRAHQIRTETHVPFTAAFRAAEKELKES